MNPDPDRLTEASTPGRAASKGGRIDRAVRALLVGSIGTRTRRMRR